MRSFFAPPSTAEIERAARNIATEYASAGKVPDSEVLGRYSIAAVEAAVSRQTCYPLVQNGERFYVFANRRG